jgi:hypothetical protein
MSTSQQPYQPHRIRAQFHTWIISEQMDVRVEGRFAIEIRMSEVGRRSKYRAFIADTLQPLPKTFGLSKLADCKSYVRSQFKEQLTDWEVIEK